ncbi:hypothetical protein GCM10010052_41890 [Paenarthrobacter histidinolovorans]|nr:hypothetical protein GCM10010052_41890 [Paenarthrobacter histidinolovorans]
MDFAAFLNVEEGILIGAKEQVANLLQTYVRSKLFTEVLKGFKTALTQHDVPRIGKGRSDPSQGFAR